ncbi:MAG: TrmH family RNA methyltransferase [Bdellovibrionia bacterium]
MIEISSAQNTHFRRWQDLGSSRGIKKHQEFILMGEKLIEEFLKNPHLKVKSEIICEGHSPLTSKLKLADKITVFKLPKALFNEIDVMGTHYNLLVLETPELKLFEPTEVLPSQARQVITPLGDPSNLGALARSALAFGAHSLVLTQESANPFHPKAIKASAGALLRLTLLTSPLKLAELLEQNLNGTVALDMNGIPLPEFKAQNALRIVIGEEGPGLPEKLKIQRVSIPTKGVESLNATVAASILLWHLSQNKVP